MQTPTFLSLVFLALFALIVAPLAISAEPQALKIGAMYPVTGCPDLYGPASVEAAEMAIAEIHTKGEAAGNKIEF